MADGTNVDGQVVESHWYVVRTANLKERQAAASLSDRGVETYLPVLHKRRPRAGRRAWELLFPCYLFANLVVPSDQWLAARSAPDVAYFLGQLGQPMPLPDDFVPGLIARVEEFNQRGSPPRFKAGDRVVVTRGPFRYYEAIFDRNLSGPGRSRVLIQLLSRLVPVDLSEDCLKKVG